MRDNHDVNALLRGLRVLVVEDAAAVADALRNLLLDVGMIVVGSVATPGDAERHLAEQLPDLALVDLHLLGGTGEALVARLRAARVPVVVISGFALLPSEISGVATLHKPFSGVELLSTLCQLISTERPKEI